MPGQFIWRIGKREAVCLNCSAQTFLFLIIVTENAVHGSVEMGENIQGFSLGDISGVDHAVYTGRIEQLNNPSDVFQVVVSVAYHAYAQSSVSDNKRAPFGALYTDP